MFQKVINRLTSDSSFAEIANKGGAFFLFKIMALLLNYAFSVVVVRHFGESVFGFVTLGFTILMISSAFSRFGFDIVLTKIFALEDDLNYKSIYYKALGFTGILSIILAALIYFNAGWIAQAIFSKPNFEVYLQWTAIAIPLWTLIPINASVFRGLKKNNLFAFFGGFGRFSLTLVIFLAYTYFLFDQDEVESPLVAHFLALGVLLLLSAALVQRYFGRMNYSKAASFMKQLATSFPIFISTTVMIALLWADKLLLGIYVSEDNVGIYEISAKLAFLIGFNLEALNSILSPKISRAFAKGEIERMQADIGFTVRLSTGISILTLIGLILFSDLLLSFFGPEFARGKPVILIVCIGQMFNVLCGPVANIMQMTGYQSLLSRVIVIALVVNIGLNIWLIPTYGIIGAAWATTITYTFWNVSCAYLIKKNLGIVSYFNPMELFKK